MRAAVVGAGMAGLAVTWYLLQKGIEVTLFDPRGIGGGTSGISTGLLHGSPGKWATPSWHADEAMLAARELLDLSERFSDVPVTNRSGILRLALTQQQRDDFLGKGIWWSEEEVLQALPHAARVPGVFMPEGITVFSKLYLEGLWKACKGAVFQKHAVQSLKELEDFDLRFLTMGSEIFRFEECKDLPLKCNIGQNVVCRWDEPIPFSILSQGHISPTEFPDLCQIGSTYEHGTAPEKEKIDELIDRVACFYPPAEGFEIVEVRSGVRIAPIEGHVPIQREVAPKTWALVGFNSRGLLYHGYLAKKMVKEIL